VTAAVLAEAAVTGRFGIDVLYLVFALGDAERGALDHGDDRQSAATGVGAVRAEAIVNLERFLGVFVADRIAIATASANCINRHDVSPSSLRRSAFRESSWLHKLPNSRKWSASAERAGSMKWKNR
jgi:hypothetical protein